jgi:GNAT superfamily N-acetyltransferase
LNSGVIEIDNALECFARGFCFTRSFTHPYVAEKLGPAWVVRDAPRTSGDYRGEEYIVNGVAAEDVDRLARKHARGRFSVCALCPAGEDDAAMRAAYKELGYRLQTTEALMVHPLKRLAPFDSPANVQRVTTMEVAEALAKEARSRQVLAEHLNDASALRQYVATIDQEIVGWVRSVLVGGMTWCSNMHVKPAFRRRGIARALLSRMLREDRDRGAQTAVLLASHTGAKLYPVVGYQQIGTLYVFKPSRGMRQG